MPRYLHTLALLCLAHAGLAQNKPEDIEVMPGVTMVELDCATNTLSRAIPYDAPFGLILKNPPKDVTTATFYFGKADAQSKLPAQPVMTYNKSGEAFYLAFPKSREFFGKDGRYLEPNTVYYLKIDFGMEDPLTKKPVLVSSLPRSVFTRTRMGDYFKADFGFGYAPNTQAVTGNTSVHLYLKPINRDADLGKLNGFGKHVLLRSSFFFGLSPLTIASSTEMPIVKLTPVGNFIYGFGWRSPFYGYGGGGGKARTFLQPMRLTFGEVVFKQNNANPLVESVSVKQAFYIGLTYDLSLAGLFGHISKLTEP